MTTYDNKPGEWYRACAVCGHDYYDHHSRTMACPRKKPYIVGVVDVWHYDSETTYKEAKSES